MVSFHSGELVELHIIEPEDYKIIREHYSRPEIRRFLIRPRKLKSVEDIKRRVSRVLRGDVIAFKVISKEFEDDSFSGIVSLEDIDVRARHAEIVYRIRKDRRGRGYATEAVRLMLKHAFEWMHLYAVYARVYEPNIASRRVLEKNGFKLVGRYPGHGILPKYSRVDLLLFAIINEDSSK